MSKARSTQPQIPIPSHLVKAKDVFTSELNERVHAGEAILNLPINGSEDLTHVKRLYSNWNDYNSELLKVSFDNEKNEYKEVYGRVNSKIFYSSARTTFIEDVNELRGNIRNKINNLQQLIEKMPLLKSKVQDVAVDSKRNVVKSGIDDSIFIVHGHDEGVKNHVARVIEKLELVPVILHEQANAGKTIIEKFEIHANVGFAIILLTGDDEGKSKMEGNTKSRARQNVILEWGYFIGKLGRERVCALYIPGVELPSDLHGILNIELDKGESWKLRLAKELKAANFRIDVNKIL